MHFHSRRKALSHFLRRCPGCPAMQCLAPPTHTHTEGFYHYSEVFCIWDMWDLASFHPPHVILYSLCVTCRVFSQCFVPGGFPVCLPVENISKPSSLGWEACFSHQIFHVLASKLLVQLHFTFYICERSVGADADVCAQVNVCVHFGVRHVLPPQVPCTSC